VKLVFLLLAGLKWGKLATTGGTMLLSLGVYAMVWGWPYAAGIVVLLFTHEMGHYVAARQRGLNVGAPTFIPFLGAWIALKDQPLDVETEAYVAMAGPLVGTVAAVAVYLWGRSTDNSLLLAIAYAGLFLNLFNLLPISPLDGGRITAIISPRVWLLGAPMMLAMLIYRPSPVLLLIAIMAFPPEIRSERAGEPRLLRRATAGEARIWRAVPGADGVSVRDDVRGARDAGRGGAAGVRGDALATRWRASGRYREM
jgi:Zn-dependent protease